MKDQIKKLIRGAILKLQKENKFPKFNIPGIEIDHPKEEKFGDYSTNIAMVLAKLVGKMPMEIANQIISNFPASPAGGQFPISNYFNKIEAIAPGYINFYLSKEYLHRIVTEINRKAQKFGNNNIGKNKKVLVEFISANPTGPITLGNGRGGPLGDTLANVLEKSGARVMREFYVNDSGKQIKSLGLSIMGKENSEYRGDYVEPFARKVPKGLKNPEEIGNWAAGMILEEMIKPACGKLGVKFDTWFSEKALHDEGKVEEALNMIKDKGLAYEKEGALWYRSTKFGDDKDRVLVKENGEKTYFAADVAYHKDKLERGFDKMINIWGADHQGDVIRVKSAVENVLDGKSKLDFILTQFVRVIKDGKEVRMSKRKGVYFALDDLIDEVGRDAVRFIFLSYTPATHINFDIDLAKERSEKNPVYYVQYAHARIASILRKAQNAGISSFQFPISNVNFDYLAHEKELSLMRELNKFPELVEEIAQSYEVHKLPPYAIKLADKFHSFYDQCQVIDDKKPELMKARLMLVNAVRIVLAETLKLMGVKAPEKM